MFFGKNKIMLAKYLEEKYVIINTSPVSQFILEIRIRKQFGFHKSQY